MEQIKLLEEKLRNLVDLVKDLKKQNALLSQENADLKERADELELLVLTGKEEMQEEKALTKEVVDDLIRSIDSLVGNEELL